MTDLTKYRNDPAARVHFIGCEGAGMKPLRRIFDELGFHTTGSDLALAGHRAENVPETPPGKLLVVSSSAVAADNPELAAAQKRSAACLRRGDALGLVARVFPCVIAVSGSHGKTDVTAMIVHILKSAGLKPGYLVGGKIRNHDDEVGGAAGDGKIFVCEADESDGAHTAIHSTLAVVTNVEDDHAWNFASPEYLVRNFRQFAQQGQKLLSEDLPLFRAHKDHVIYDGNALDSDPRFRRFAPYLRTDMAIAAEAVAMLGLLDREAALDAGASFPGVERRMQRHGDACGFTLYEDYAHHPTELAAALCAFRELFPGRPLKLVFQPHRYARLKRYFTDFVRELAQADEVFIPPVFAAWTEAGEVDSERLGAALGKKAHLLAGSWEEMAGQVRANVESGDLVAVVGAGDVHKIIAPLKARLFVWPDAALIVAAGGVSARFGSGNKLFAPLGGVPLFIHALRRLAGRFEAKDRVFLAVPGAEQAEFARLLKKYLPDTEVRIVAGGGTRTASVGNALKALPKEVEIVAVHDAARPLITAEALDACVSACRKYGGAVSAHPQTDTLKEADSEGNIVRTAPREHLWAVQTPQVFRRDLLEQAYRAAENGTGTDGMEQFADDDALVAAFTHHKARLVRNPAPNPKVTYPEDLETVRALYERSSGSPGT